MTIPNQAFILKDSPLTPVATAGPGASPFPHDGGGSKHVKMIYDPIIDKIISSGGDYGPYGSGGRSTMFSYDVATNTWALISGECHQTGQITPFMGITDDGAPFYVDLKRNRRIVFPGSTAFATIPQPCRAQSFGQPSGSTYDFGVLTRDPTTGVWTILVNGNSTFPNLPPGSPGHGMHTTWDPVKDVLFFTDDAHINVIDASGPPFTTLKSIPFAQYNANTKTFYSGTPIFMNSVPNGYWWQSLLRFVPTFGIDVIGRKLYMMAVTSCSVSISGAGIADFKDVQFFSLDLDTYVLSLLPRPPLPTAGPGALTITSVGGNSPFGVFDTKNRAYIFFHTKDEVAVVQGVYVYPVSTGAWESYPVVSDSPRVGSVAGNSWVYNPKENVCVGGGSVFGPPTVRCTCWWWRYK